MKTNKIMRWAIACGIAMLSVVSVASDIALGKWERYTFDGSTPAIGTGEGLFLNGSEASFSFASDGTMTLPLGNVFPFVNTSVGVRRGVLQLTQSSRPDLVANPPSELQKAALWLDQGKNLQTNVIGGNTCVLAWYDAREPSAAASSYGYAAASDTTGSGPQFVTIRGISYIDFVEYKSNNKRSFLYKNADGTARTYAVRHAFFVLLPKSSKHTGPVLGNLSSANFFTYPTGSHIAMLSFAGNANPLAYSCEYLLDGVHGNPTASIVSGTHLHEFTLPPNRTIDVDSLMNDRNIASGGWYLHEILLFETPLTVTERMRITAYLKEKWNCGDYGTLSFDTTKDVTVEVASGVSPDSLQVFGAGAMGIGSGVSSSAAHLYADAGKVRRPYVLRDATSSLDLQAADYEYMLSPRESLSVTATRHLSTLTKSSSGSVGNAVVSSERNFIVSELDPAITNLMLSGGGDLVLRAPSSEDPAYEAGTVSVATFASTSLSIPAGNAGTETSVTVPIAGDWEIEFDMSNAFSSSSGAGVAYYRVYLMDGDANVWEKNPTIVAPAAYNGANQHRRYLVHNLAAGTYTFRAAGKAQTAIAASLSNLAMKYVPNPANETVVPVTDGDFEADRFEHAFYASYENNVGERTPWTLTNAGYESDPPFQTVVSSYMGYSGSYGYMFRSSQLGRYGDNALLWYHTNSTATSSATLLPAGTYRLRFDAVRWMTGTTSHGKLPNADAGRCNTAATLTASVIVNGGEPVSIGEVGPISNFTLETLSFPETVTVSEGDSVVLVLNQKTANGAVQLDNFEFVRVEGGVGASATLGEELVQDGSCASTTSAYWKFDDWTNTYRHVALIRTPIDNAFGTTKCDGDYVIRSANGGRAYQTIAFPAGVFRLSWWSRARVSSGNVSPGNQTTTTFWYAADGSSVTNEIVKSEISWCTNFLEHVAYFSVPTAGSYVFGFNSEDKSGADVLVDCVSIKQVLGPEATPEIPEYAQINVTGGGKLRLDYNGCLDLAKVKVNGHPLTGEISAATYPDYVCGPGRAFVKPKGFVLMIQ